MTKEQARIEESRGRRQHWSRWGPYNRERTRKDPEFELADTGVFADGRYFDVLVEYAKAASDDILIRITVSNRAPEATVLHLLPSVWFRNTWSWAPGVTKPELRRADG